MKITENILVNLKKHHITRGCFLQRVARGWTVADAQRTPIVKPGYDYEVFSNRAGTGVSQIFTGTTEVARYLTKKTHTTVTKNALVGQIYRKGFAIIENFLIRPTK